MSNPFYGIGTVNLPFSGNADGNGNFTTTLRPRPGFWCSLKMVGRVGAGFPIWEITDGAIPLGIGRGQQAEIAGLVVPPGASVIINVTGAKASTTVVGRLIGIQGPDMNSIAQGLILAPNSVSVAVTTTRPFSTVVIGPSLGSTSSVHVPDASGFLPGDFILAANPASGAQSIAQISSIVADTAIPPVGSIINIIGIWSAPYSLPSSLDVIQLLPSMNPTRVPYGSALSSVGIQGVAMTINTDFTILAGAGFLRIYVHAVHLMTNSSAFTSIELWDGPSASGTLIGVLANDGTAVGAVPMTWDGKGRPGTVGNALVGRPTNTSVGASIWGAVGVSVAP